MAIEKALLLKGLGVCALCAGGTTVAFKWKDINSAFSSSSRKKEKISVAGLECEEPTGQEGGECSIKTGEEGGKIFVKKESSGSHFEVTTFGEGKIKVYKVKGEGEQGYKKGFKFLIEDGDITGSGNNNKLEEFESYEVKEWSEGDSDDLKGKQYFSRKTDSKTEIKNALGLLWDLPDDSKEQTGITTENVGAIKFSGGPATLSNGSVTLKITKETKKTEYPLGYKFTFKNTNTSEDATLAIGSEAIKIKNVSPIDYDFKIKRNGSSLSLEKAWSIEDLAKKVGLAKDGTGDYWDVGAEGLNIKVDTATKKDKKTKKAGSTGKIKVSEGQTEYNGGLKFTIENDDLNLDDGGSSTIILGQFQSYEIVKEGDKLYLSKKDDGQERIKELLGIKCEVPTGQDGCSLTTKNIGSIKFKGGTATLSGGNVTLAITKDTTGNDYPLGFKFSFKNTNDSDAILTIDKEVITLKKESPVEFKIKKSESDPTSLTLEKAWTLDDLTKKVGLKKDKDLWDVNESNLNVKQNTNKDSQRKRQTNQDGRIKVYRDQKGYNEGLKLVVEKGDINLETKQSSTVNILGQYETYEFSKEEDGKWYLTRKTEDREEVKKLLSFPCDLPTGNASVECSISTTNIGTIKFEGGTASISGSPKLTVSAGNSRYSYPLGYRFTFSSEKDSSITIPTSPETKITLKKDLSVDFKIKRKEGSYEISLEKAWTPESLMEEVSLKKSGSNDWWSLGDGYVSIKQGDNKSSEVTKNGGSNNAKIRVYEGSPGYNQGYKFVIEDGDSGLSGGNISKLSKYESYEVSVDSKDNNYYFTKKLNTSESIREILGLPSTCQMPTDQDTSKTCSLSVNELNEVKFKDKSDTGSVTVTGGTSVTLKITKETGGSFPLNYKFSFDSLGTTSFTIPKSGGESITVNESSNTEFKIKEAGGKSTLEKVGG